ncbi:hypothetical protein [Brevibacterium litoralis]|uniref:hypothetical protein n=1 Tax=Brevibacterium litoralis TaxID=3138935 RepID=UPI0032EF6807
MLHPRNTSDPSSPRSTGTGAPADRPVGFQDALVFGAVAAGVVFVITLLVTKAWLDPRLLGYVAIYAAVAFVSVSGISALLHLVTRKSTEKQRDQQFPVLD